MYESYWGLSEKPFENTPNPKFFFTSAQHEEGLTRLLYGIRERKGAVMLTGVFGCGKTLLANTLFSELEKDLYQTAFIVNPRMEPLDLLRYLTHELGGKTMPEKKAECMVLLKSVLMNNYQDGKESVIVIDEAHTIEDEHVFEEIRLLLNFQLPDRFLATILLLGQPELTPMVKASKQLDQRIAIRYHLEALNSEEAKGYVKHRLGVAGRKEPIFKEEALKLLHSRSGGIPRRINQIADMALFVGFSQKKRLIDRAGVEEAIRSLEG
ncbi:MAG: AAA family ATPase [Deltaproteobacteria bacterium]|nr:AAA family ATPase [Deltaproteobacteria bacterium]MBI4224145.1 AAA family ATPase [Deltaproteobacteria bacterium]